MQEAIKKEFGLTAELKAGHGGVFDVALNRRVVYSKDVTYRFPTNEEVFARIREQRKA